MIRVGLAGWGGHDDLYNGVKAKDQLSVYGSHFPVVEVDSSFYAIQRKTSFERWAGSTPSDFKFVIKAYQGMTGHLRTKNPYSDHGTMFEAFKDSISPVIEAGKLSAVLFQYPPWCDCTRANVTAIREAKSLMGDIPVALEFRNQSWFTDEMRERTLDFMEREGWIHSICDEPQAGEGSVPTVLHPTSRQLTIVRMHGRNTAGWTQGSAPNWREVRYLYHYSREELTEWKMNLDKLQKGSEEICVIFNNNSGGHAAENAKEMMRLLGQDTEPMVPRQLDLFE